MLTVIVQTGVFCAQLFKEEIEKPDQRGEALLDPTDVKMIFGKIPPIYDVHMKMRDELSELTHDWDENCLVGDIYIRNVRTGKSHH